jgi:protein CLEC16A
MSGYLLSNNHINALISHEFDCSNEEILSYYVSFLKVLSHVLDGDTIYFFRNEHLSDFPLYSEAVKFFNHHDTMTRVAVWTVILKIF